MRVQPDGRTINNPKYISPNLRQRRSSSCCRGSRMQRTRRIATVAREISMDKDDRQNADEQEVVMSDGKRKGSLSAAVNAVDTECNGSFQDGMKSDSQQQEIQKVPRWCIQQRRGQRERSMTDRLSAVGYSPVRSEKVGVDFGRLVHFHFLPSSEHANPCGDTRAITTGVGPRLPS